MKFAYCTYLVTTCSRQGSPSNTKALTFLQYLWGCFQLPNRGVVLHLKNKQNRLGCVWYFSTDHSKLYRLASGSKRHSISVPSEFLNTSEIQESQSPFTPNNNNNDNSDNNNINNDNNSNSNNNNFKKSEALQLRRAMTDWSSCCQMAVQGALWLAGHLSLNLNFSFLYRILLLLISSSYPIVLTRLGGPCSRSYTSRKISRV